MSRFDVFSLYSEELKKDKTIRVYQSDIALANKQPTAVLYMHDGQNLFDPKTASYGVSWEVPTAIKMVEERTNRSLLVVGIDSEAADRWDEYSPVQNGAFAKSVRYSPREYVGGKADRYIAFLVQTLKPYIDEHYPTLTNESYLAGSSMGGIVSLAGGVWYPHIFRKIGVFSPAYWFHQEAIESWLSTYRDVHLSIYQDIGTNETSNAAIADFPSRYLEGARRVATLLQTFPHCELTYLEIENAVHNERDWAKRLPEFLFWLLHSSSNYL
jgi:predicted alpha/beta superfamily hydrolase